MSEKLQNAALILVVSCAVLLTGMTINRELNPGQRDEKGTHISDWRTFATAGHSIGRTDGKLTVVVFSDYECPFCRLLNSKIDSIQVARPDARIVFRDFPLTGHLNARPAARAVICADEQKKFREYHDALFSSASSEKGWDFIQLAETIGLERDRFAACLGSPRTDSLIDANINAGKKLGVEGTPAILVNDKLYLGLPNNVVRIARKAPAI